MPAYTGNANRLYISYTYMCLTRIWDGTLPFFVLSLITVYFDDLMSNRSI